MRIYSLRNSTAGKATLENPILAKPTPDKPTQLNKELSNKEILNTNVIKYPSINQVGDGKIDEYNRNIQIVKDE